MRYIVNIVDPNDPLPAYLFVREKQERGDRLMFIAANGDGHHIGHLAHMLGIEAKEVTAVVMPTAEDDLKYEHISRHVLKFLEKGTRYLVNLAGGTRYMALAAQHVFKGFDSQFFYVKTRENEIVSTIFDDSLYDEDDISVPIRYRMGIAEYLALHGLDSNLADGGHEPIRDRQAVLRFFRSFAYNQLANEDYDTLNKLRIYYRPEIEPLEIGRLVRHGVGTAFGKRKPALRHLQQLFNKVGFEPEHRGTLLHAEVEYLTGGWFEDYVYYLVRDALKPNEAATGIVFARPGERHTNELDVTFIKNNQFFVVECKTGVQSDHLFNEIVYKACALREGLLGVATHSYIFSLKSDADGHLKQVARLMNIEFCDRRTLTTEGINAVFARMRQICR
ncbi:MAG: DUF1887 family CARF protein [Bacteroidales bacterium]|nr:DUF1887 family CARF protein [Bacteroidales bacterium]